MKSSVTLDSRLLAILGQRNPAIYDAIIPRFGPHPDPWRSTALSWVALNPQPLPPHELGAAVAAEFVRTLWLADRFGLDLARIRVDLDDWCPVPPKWPKLPPWWPPVPQPDPPPRPEWSADFHLGFAARLSALALEGSGIGELVAVAIERSVTEIERSVSEINSGAARRPTL